MFILKNLRVYGTLHRNYVIKTKYLPKLSTFTKNISSHNFGHLKFNTVQNFFGKFLLHLRIFLY